MQASALGILMLAALGVGPCVAHGYLAEAGEREPAVSSPPARDTAPPHHPCVSSGPPREVTPGHSPCSSSPAMRPQKQGD